MLKTSYCHGDEGKIDLYVQTWTLPQKFCTALTMTRQVALARNLIRVFKSSSFFGGWEEEKKVNWQDE